MGIGTDGERSITERRQRESPRARVGVVCVRVRVIAFVCVCMLWEGSPKLTGRRHHLWVPTF